jgi:hypothetical protein
MLSSIGLMQEVTRAIEVSAQLGTDAARLSTLLDEARRRDAGLAAAMLAAASAPDLQPPALEALFDRAQALGLKGDAAAAKHVLDRRRRILVANITQLVSQDPSAGDFQRKTACVQDTVHLVYAVLPKVQQIVKTTL